jgi:DNA-binding PadR family transcriptional regulator
MPIHHAILGLLSEGPSYGYQLKTNFEEAVGPQWGELNIGHLYQVLDRLIRDRLVTRREVAQTDRPDKVVYRLTKAGHVELDRWLHTPFVRTGGYRDDFFLKLMVASRLGKERLDEVLRTQREAYLAELAVLGELRTKYHGQALISLLLEAASLHTEVNLKIAERAEERIALLTTELVPAKEPPVAEADAG